MLLTFSHNVKHLTILEYFQLNNILNTYPTFSGINIILVHIPGHPKICHLTLLSFANKNISCRQVTMYNLEKKAHVSFFKGHSHAILVHFKKKTYILTSITTRK